MYTSVVVVYALIIHTVYCNSNSDFGVNYFIGVALLAHTPSFVPSNFLSLLKLK